MIVNGKEYDISKLVDNLNLNANKFIYFGNIFLTQKEIDILDYYQIDYKSSNTFKDLIMKVQILLEDEGYDDELEDLDWVLTQISERDYYQNTRK